MISGYHGNKNHVYHCGKTNKLSNRREMHLSWSELEMCCFTVMLALTLFYNVVLLLNNTISVFLFHFITLYEHNLLTPWCNCVLMITVTTFESTFKTPFPKNALLKYYNVPMTPNFFLTNLQHIS